MLLVFCEKGSEYLALACVARLRVVRPAMGGVEVLSHARPASVAVTASTRVKLAFNCNGSHVSETVGDYCVAVHVASGHERVWHGGVLDAHWNEADDASAIAVATQVGLALCVSSWVRGLLIIHSCCLLQNELIVSWDAHEESRFALPPRAPQQRQQQSVHPSTTVRWSPGGAAVLVSESDRVLLIEPV